ncbi:MAG: hypothetical protein V3V89_03680, partial [Gammaproteobacteria bacterium]
ASFKRGEPEFCKLSLGLGKQAGHQVIVAKLYLVENNIFKFGFRSAPETDFTQRGFLVVELLIYRRPMKNSRARLEFNPVPEKEKIKMVGVN